MNTPCFPQAPTVPHTGEPLPRRAEASALVKLCCALCSLPKFNEPWQLTTVSGSNPGDCAAELVQRDADHARLDCCRRQPLELHSRVQCDPVESQRSQQLLAKILANANRDGKSGFL